MDGLTRNFHPALGVIDGQVAQGEWRRVIAGVGRSRFAKRGPDPSRQLSGRERLDHVVGCAQVKSPLDVLIPTVGRKADHRHVCDVDDVLHQLETVDARQLQIQKGEVGFFRPNLVQRIIRAGGE